MNKIECLIAGKSDIEGIRKMAERYCSMSPKHFTTWCDVINWPEEVDIIRDDRITFITKGDNKITGVLILHSSEPSSNSSLSKANVAEFELATDPSFLKRGIATHLLNCAIQHAKKNTNVNQLKAKIESENDASITLCKCKFKFRIVSTQREGITMALDI